MVIDTAGNNFKEITNRQLLIRKKKKIVKIGRRIQLRRQADISPNFAFCPPYFCLFGSPDGRWGPPFIFACQYSAHGCPWKITLPPIWPPPPHLKIPVMPVPPLETSKSLHYSNVRATSANREVSSSNDTFASTPDLHGISSAGGFWH